MRDLDIDKLLEVQDSSDVKSPGLLMYTKGMPAAVLSNISTLLGIVNGAQGRAIGVIPDPDGTYTFQTLLRLESILTTNSQIYPIDSLYVLCTLPPNVYCLSRPQLLMQFSLK